MTDGKNVPYGVGMEKNTYRPKPAERQLLQTLHQLGPSHQATYEELAEILNVTTRTIQNLIRKLKKAGLIEVSASRRYHWRILTAKGKEAL